MARRPQKPDATARRPRKPDLTQALSVDEQVSLAMEEAADASPEELGHTVQGVVDGLAFELYLADHPPVHKPVRFQGWMRNYGGVARYRVMARRVLALLDDDDSFGWQALLPGLVKASNQRP